MARYIDLEELAKRINENIKPDTPEENALIEWCKDECIRQGYAMPTADVVPRSEVEKLEEHIDDLNDSKEHLCVMLEEARADVAREIFEEIEEHIKGVGFSSFAERFEFIDWIAELKKKYTEK